MIRLNLSFLIIGQIDRIELTFFYGKPKVLSTDGRRALSRRGLTQSRKFFQNKRLSG